MPRNSPSFFLCTEGTNSTQHCKRKLVQIFFLLTNPVQGCESLEIVHHPVVYEKSKTEKKRERKCVETSTVFKAKGHGLV